MIKLFEIMRGYLPHLPSITFYDFDDTQVRSDDSVREGYFLTDSELEQLAKECFEAGRSCYQEPDVGFIDPEFKDFATFWTERKEKVKDEKN